MVGNRLGYPTSVLRCGAFLAGAFFFFNMPLLKKMHFVCFFDKESPFCPFIGKWAQPDRGLRSGGRAGGSLRGCGQEDEGGCLYMAFYMLLRRAFTM